MDKPTEADWILRVMIAVAGADGRLDAREVRIIQDVYEDLTGRSVEVSGVVLAVKAYVTKRDVLAELSIVEGSMPGETKEKIIRGAYLTLLAKERGPRLGFFLSSLEKDFVIGLLDQALQQQQ